MIDGRLAPARGGTTVDAVDDKPAWIDLDGAVNVRDLGGVTAVDGRVVRAHRLIRADNLQDLSGDDVDRLLGEYEVRRIVDLRTDVERRSEGPPPLAGHPRVDIQPLSLFVEPDDVQLVNGTAGPEVLPWQSVPASDETRTEAVESYLAFLAQRPDNVLTALRTIAQQPGATIVHCAAGKDRTGVVVALALGAVGVPEDRIVADYGRSAERIERIVARLVASATYADDMDSGTLDHHRPQPASMQRFLTTVGQRFGGVAGWLAARGWTANDQRALERALFEA